MLELELVLEEPVLFVLPVRTVRAASRDPRTVLVPRVPMTFTLPVV